MSLSAEELDIVLTAVRRFIRREVWLWEKRIDPNASRLPPEVFDDLHAKAAAMDLDHLLAPAHSDAVPCAPLCLSDADRARIAEETSQHRAGATAPAYGLFDPDPPPQLYAATAEQRERLLAPLLSRQSRAFRGVADPDLEHLPVDGVRARALRRGDSWMLDGTKIFVADAQDADFGIIYANTEHERGDRDGVTAFIVECDRVGFQRWRDWPTIAVGRQTVELNLSAVKLPPENVLGDVGRGPLFANDLGLRRRVFSAAHLTGVASAAQDMARGQVWSRREHGAPIASGERARLALADSEIAVAASRQLYLSAAAASDSGGDLLQPALVARAFASDAAAGVVERTMQLHGAAGGSSDLPLERWARELAWRRLDDGGADQQRFGIADQLLTTFKK